MKKGINKSAAILELHKKSPDLTATKIVAQLAKDGITVSNPLVYNVLRKGSKSTPKKRGRKPGTSTVKAVAKPSSTNDLFASMKSFVEAAGGLDKAIEILSVFKK